MKTLAFLTEYQAVDWIIDQLKLTFEAAYAPLTLVLDKDYHSCVCGGIDSGLNKRGCRLGQKRQIVLPRPEENGLGMNRNVMVLSVFGLSIFYVGMALAQEPTRAAPVPDAAALVVQVTSPNGGETWKAGEKRQITWVVPEDAQVTGITISFSITSGSAPATVVSLSGNPSFYEWQVPDVSSSSCLVLIEVTDASGNRARDQSDKVFTIIKETTPEPQPDLISIIGSTGTTAPLQDVSITVTVKNAGTGTAPESFCDVVFRNRRPPRQLLRRYQKRIPDLAPGGMFVYTFSIKLGLGPYEVCAIADGKKQVRESDETNNRACITLIGK
jgi:hypothetical protein